MFKIIYVGDPMCSWCWGFAETLREVSEAVGELPVQYVMGGLAPDSDEPMPEETRAYIQGQWKLVTAETGATFNWSFWDVCEPRRSTYPSCRAVIAASRQDKHREMFEAIQHAYYQEARNPSDLLVLAEIATEIGLDRDLFASDIRSDAVEEELQAGFNVRRGLQANSFPSLLLVENEQPATWLARGYGEPNAILARLKEAGASPVDRLRP